MNKKLSECDVSLQDFKRLGVFADWSLPTDEDIRFVAEDLAFDDIIVGLWPKKNEKGWKCRFKIADVLSRVISCESAGLNPVLMMWGLRDELAIMQMCSFAGAIMRRKQMILLDLEEGWYHGSINAVSAGMLVAKKLSGRSWGVTGIARVTPTVAPIVGLSTFNVPQCYSFWKPGGDHWSHSKATFPGAQQRNGVIQWRRANGDAKIIMGLGGYWAERPANRNTPMLSLEQTMRMSAIETLACGVDSAWYWSLKWLKKKTKTGRRTRRFFGIID